MSKYKNTVTYSGKLLYNDEAQYGLQFPSGLVNISEILDKVCNSSKKYIEVKIMNCCKLIFAEQGNLLKYKSYDTGVVDYHINGNCLGDVLFFNTGELLDVTIYADALNRTGDRCGYGKQQTTNQVIV